jgi:hypothetical protein
MGKKGQEQSATLFGRRHRPYSSPLGSHFLYEGDQTEMHHNKAHLPLRIKGDAPAFATKWRRAPRNACLTLLE